MEKWYIEFTVREENRIGFDVKTHTKCFEEEGGDIWTIINRLQKTVGNWSSVYYKQIA